MPARSSISVSVMVLSAWSRLIWLAEVGADSVAGEIEGACWMAADGAAVIEAAAGAATVVRASGLRM